MHRHHPQTQAQQTRLAGFKLNRFNASDFRRVDYFAELLSERKNVEAANASSNPAMTMPI